MAVGAMSDADMRQLIESGAAKPLLVGFEVGPTVYADAWWYVPKSSEDRNYVTAGPELSADFDQLQARVDNIDTVLARLEPTNG